MSSLINDYARKATEANQIASDYINDKTPEIFAYNHNFTAYEFEKNSGISFSIIDKNVVKELATGQNHTEFRTLSVNKKATYNWNKEKIQRELTAGIIQGKSIPKIANDFYKIMGSNKKASVRNARTAVTSAQNGGRQQGFNQAQELGINFKKKWLDAHDNRVRDSHAELNGEMVDPDKPFSNGLMYPSDPSGAPSEVYNCRCTMRAVIERARRSLETSKLTFKQYIEGKMKDGLKIMRFSSSNPKPSKTYDELVSKIKETGFTPMKSLRKLNEELLGSSVNQLQKLDKKFKIIDKCNGIFLSGTNDTEKTYARAFVEYNWKKENGWKLHLCQSAYSRTKDENMRVIGKLVKSGMYMPCIQENYEVYEVTHEYGHIVEFLYLKEKYIDKGYNGKLEDLYELVKNEIIDIAYATNPSFKIENNISKYGSTTPQDFFAEAFTNSQLGSLNELGIAMLQWLKRNKIC